VRATGGAYQLLWRPVCNGYVSEIIDKAAFDPGRFMSEVRRAIAGRPVRH
jgi:hypothetical protein